jgi:AAA15 family ATPase/GTPase
MQAYRQGFFVYSNQQNTLFVRCPCSRYLASYIIHRFIISIMQFRRVSIKAFRGIQDLEFYDLGRINLLVGQNNCGKTSVLEAMHVLGNCKVNGTFPYSTRVNTDNTDHVEIVEYLIPVRSKNQMLFISGYQPLLSKTNDELE